MKTKLLVLMFTALCTGALGAAESTEGRRARAEFSLSDISGKKHSLGDFKGKYVVLECFNPGCPFVQKHYKSDNMQALQKQFTSKDVVWLTIESSAPGKEGYLTPEEANKQIADWKIKATALLLDPDGKVGHEYTATNTPHMYIVDPSGKLIYSGAIDSKPTANPDDIPASTNYVKAALGGSDGGQTGYDPELARLRLLDQIRELGGRKRLRPRRCRRCPLGSARICVASSPSRFAERNIYSQPRLAVKRLLAARTASALA